MDGTGLLPVLSSMKFPVPYLFFASPTEKQVEAGYVKGYNAYLAHVGGAAGVPDPTCRGQAWVKPITLLDSYLRFYQLMLLGSSDAVIQGITEAAPPKAGAATSQPSAAATARTGRALAAALRAQRRSMGSNAVAIGSAGTRRVTIMAKQPDGSLAPVHHTFWWTRYGPMFNNLSGISLPWGTSQGFAFGDVNAGNLARAVNTWFGIDRATTTQQVLSILQKYQGIPWVNTIVSDREGVALYADIGAIPNVTDAHANTCNTPLGQVTFALVGLPIPDGFAVQAPGRVDAPALGGRGAEEPRTDLPDPRWPRAQAGFRVYRDWLAVVNRYGSTAGRPIFISATNTFVADAGVPPAQNYPAGWLRSALAVVAAEPQVQALIWFLDEPTDDGAWDFFSLTRRAGRLIDAADELDALLR